MSALVGKWRIVEMELWDADYLDLVEPAYIRFDPRGTASSFSGPLPAALIAATLMTALTLLGKGMTKWTKLPAAAGPSSATMGPSAARSKSISGISLPSKLANGSCQPAHPKKVTKTCPKTPPTIFLRWHKRLITPATIGFCAV
jgi:hypothetical protein